MEIIKKCPYCGGEIPEEAQKCKHCGEWITPPAQPVQQQVVVNQVEPQPSNGIGIAGFVISLVCIFLCWIPGLNIIVWLVGFILSLIGIFKKPRGLAIAGLVISSIMAVIMVAILGAITLAIFENI